jgi:hypothetical protein
LILKTKIDYDLTAFLSADYEQHHGSCISYQVREQEDIHQIFGGFPKSYSEENTRIQQLWFDDGDIDYALLGAELGIEVITVSSILQPPGNVITMHRDTFFKINNQYPNDTRKKVRANIYLEDWAPGHFINYQDENKQWQTSTHWQAGEGFVWDSEHLHLSANAGLTPKYTLQVSGFWNKTVDTTT